MSPPGGQRQRAANGPVTPSRHAGTMKKPPHRTAVCLISMEVQGGRPHIRVTLNPNSQDRSAQQETLTFADIEAALGVVRAFAERWRDDARLTTRDPGP